MIKISTLVLIVAITFTVSLAVNAVYADIKAKNAVTLERRLAVCKAILSPKLHCGIWKGEVRITGPRGFKAYNFIPKGGVK